MRVVVMQDFTLSGTQNQFTLLGQVAPMWVRGDQSKETHMHLICTTWSLCFRFLLNMESYNVQQ